MSVALDVLLGASSLLLCLGAIGYRSDSQRVARTSAATGFGLLAIVLGTLAFGYVAGDRSDWLLLAAVTTAGAGLGIHAIRLVQMQWDRSDQLVTMAAVAVVVLVSFELAPGLRVAVQEALARQLVALAGTLGYHPTLESTAGGALTRLSFDNGAHYQITRECSGIEAVALFGGILLGVRTTLWRRLAGIGFMLGAVYAVNMARMLFVVAALSGDWFGPLLTTENTVQMTYYVAEVGLGQSLVVLASVAGYLWVSRWIPDGTAFARDLLDTLDTTSN